MKMSDTDTKQFDTLINLLALKASQIIVQARMGQPAYTKCIPMDLRRGSFNLNIQEVPDILAEVKKLLSFEKIAPTKPLCVEISLETPDKDIMMLEYWCLELLPEKCDPIDSYSTIHNRMGMLLKSLLSVTRVIPAYKLSKRQGHESFIICYDVFIGEPQLHNLGEGFRQKTVAQICTPVGTVQLNVSYRTKMTISPTQTKDNSIMVKSDHFESKENLKNEFNKDYDQHKPQMVIGAFADQIKKETEENIPELPIIAKFRKMKEAREQELRERREKQEQEEQEIQKLKEREEQDMSDTEIQLPSLSTLSIYDDFLLVDMKTPFAPINKYSEIHDFYKKIRSVPQIQFSETMDTADEAITQLLQECEEELDKYDEVMRSLQQTPENY